MIFKGSRYEKLAKAAYILKTAAGSEHTALPMRLVPRAPASVRHTVSSNERLDLIAFLYYRDPERFWLIADGNESMDPEELLDVGREIFIPADRGV